MKIAIVKNNTGYIYSIVREKSLKHGGISSNEDIKTLNDNNVLAIVFWKAFYT